jgi:hypothetical protein
VTKKSKGGKCQKIKQSVTKSVATKGGKNDKRKLSQDEESMVNEHIIFDCFLFKILVKV